MKSFIMYFLQSILASIVVGPKILSVGRQAAKRGHYQSGLPRSFLQVILNAKSQGSSVSIVTGVRAGRLKNHGYILGRVKRFFSTWQYLYQGQTSLVLK
jgi:hypothetical protein